MNFRCLLELCIQPLVSQSGRWDYLGLLLLAIMGTEVSMGENGSKFHIQFPGFRREGQKHLSFLDLFQLLFRTNKPIHVMEHLGTAQPPLLLRLPDTFPSNLHRSRHDESPNHLLQFYGYCKLNTCSGLQSVFSG